jgi:hypothetical protein
MRAAQKVVLPEPAGPMTKTADRPIRNQYESLAEHTAIIEIADEAVAERE